MNYTLQSTAIAFGIFVLILIALIIYAYAFNALQGFRFNLKQWKSKDQLLSKCLVGVFGLSGFIGLGYLILILIGE